MAKITSIEKVLQKSQLQGLGFLTYRISDVKVTLHELEDDFSPGVFTPEIETGEFFESEDKGTRVFSIQKDQLLGITFKWTQSGTFANFPEVPVKFRWELLFEQMGVGEFGSTKSDNTGKPQDRIFEEKFFPGQQTYGMGIGFTIKHFPEGIFRVYAVFKVVTTDSPLLDPRERNQTPIAGFADLGTINVYQAD